MNKIKRIQISIIGAGRANQKLCEKAEKVGRLLGARNVCLVCGGGGGVMEATCRGLQESGSGLAVGVIKEDQIKYGNNYLDSVICTNIGEARNLSVVLSGQAIIAIGGKEGTLSEIAFALKYKKPLFGIDTWEHPNFDFPNNLTPEDAVTRALDAVKNVS